MTKEKKFRLLKLALRHFEDQLVLPQGFEGLAVVIIIFIEFLAEDNDVFTLNYKKFPFKVF